VTSIGLSAFRDCSGMTEITSNIQEPFAIDYCWNGVDKSIPLYVPAGTKEKYQSTVGWKGFTNIIEMKETTGIRSIDEGLLTMECSTEGRLQGKNEAGTWYTLDGRKLSGRPAQKGVYIVNGRKIAIK